jgi:hypothetical protein
MCANTPMIMSAAQQVTLITQARVMVLSIAGSRLMFAIVIAQASKNASWIRLTSPPPTLT